MEAPKCRVCGGSQCGPGAHPSKRILDHAAGQSPEAKRAILALARDAKAAQDLARDLHLLRIAGVSVDEIKEAVGVMLEWPVR